MKRILVLLAVLATSISCEDVIDVELNTTEPKLVIEASINLLEDGSSSSTVKLSTTAPFFDSEIPIVDNATVVITDENGIIYPFAFTTDGIYSSTLIPELGIDYTLEVILHL